MSKNMTRKGLAFGAGLSMIAAGFAGTPAAAAETLTLLPSAGTSYGTLANSTFTLETGFPSSVTDTSYKYLKYRVENAGLASLTVNMKRGSSSVTDERVSAYLDDDATPIQGPALNFLSETFTVSGVASDDSNDEFDITVTESATFVDNAYYLILDDGSLANFTGDNKSEFVEPLAVQSATGGDTTTLVIDGSANTVEKIAGSADAFAVAGDSGPETQTGLTTSMVRVTVQYDDSTGTVLMDTASSHGLGNNDSIYVGDLDTVGLDAAIESAIENTVHTLTSNTSGSVLEFDVASGLGSNDEFGAVTSGTFVELEGQDGSTTTVSDDDFVVAPADQSTGPAAAQGSENSLTIGAPNAQDTVVTVTAWIDIDNDERIDPGEDVSPSRTITFYEVSEVQGNVSLKTPVGGEDSLTAYVTFVEDINVQQIQAGDVLVEFGQGSTYTKITSYADSATAPTAAGNTAITDTDELQSNANDVVWNSTDSVFEAVFNPFDVDSSGTTDFEVSANETYYAKLFIDNNDNGTTDVSSDTQEGETASSKTGVAATNYSAKVTLTANEDAKTSTVGYEDNGTDNYEDPKGTAVADNVAMVGEVRTSATGSSAATLNVFVGTDVQVPAGVKSVPVTVTVSANSNVTLSDGITVEGETVYNGQTRSITKSTATNGTVSFAIGAGKADADDALNFEISMNGTDFGSGSSDNDAVVNFDAADYSIYEVNDLAGSGYASIVEGGSVTLNYVMVDQWGQAPANNKYRIVVNDNANSERDTDADFAYTANVVDGAASITVTDTGEGLGTTTARAAWATLDGALQSSSGDTVDTVLKIVADATPAAFDQDDIGYGTEQLEDANGDGDYSDSGDTDLRSKLLLETEDINSFDSRTAAATETAPTPTANQEVTLAGTLEDADGNALAGVPMTLTAAGFLFEVGSNFATDSVTLWTDSDGEYSVNLYSTVGGTQTVTLAAGSVTTDVELKFAPGTSASEELTVVASATGTPGTTTNIVATVKDKFGNPVEDATVDFSGAGVGYLAQAQVSTDANGVAVGKLVTAVNDKGDAVITVGVNGNDDIDDQTVTITFGATASADQKVNAGTFKGYVALYAKGYEGQRMSAIVAGKWLEVESLDSNYERIVRFTGAGYDIKVRIYIDGVQVGPEFDITTK